ncbi:Fpg/Nei family DNA glycosylase [Corynebacterium sp. 3HC-13]|uniref:DNA-formamidopyrimidine glycosylase family protein n=1 Tax=Corynebacterium poyangense TaxID=2684405 RepID=UPI001CCC9E62|nr:DNA-formamidopyrimidine glycosylase family protein [Corynebacterium poyangense]MBZ8176317.1 Fpg/Nei family DNA glycosylase [Corynebacterium poyangense]
MPEGDSVYQLSQRFQFLSGRLILGCDIRVPSFAVTDFRGRRIEAIWPYGKHLFIQCGDDVLHTHLKMEGRWDIHYRGERWTMPGHTARVVLQVSGDRAHNPIEVVGHNLGFVRVFPAENYYREISHLGPDILAKDWEEGGREEAVARVLAHPDVPIGVALLDQRNLAGIGNEYRAEICFISGVHPATLVGDLGDEKIRQMILLSHDLMIANRDATLRVTTGVRRAGESSYVFGRNHQPCRRCGTLIRSGFLGPQNSSSPQDRVIWWCPHCQPAPSPWQ